MKNKLTKAAKVMELLNKNPQWSNSRIAVVAKCHATYVYMLRNKMIHREEPVIVPVTPEVAEEAQKVLEEVNNAGAIQMGGDHYRAMAVQPWDVFDTWPEEQRIGAYRGNCLKYVLRLDVKDSRLLNAQKLAHYAVKLVEVLQEMEG